MDILLTTHQMADFAGSEIYTYELAKALRRAGHTVIVYSRYIDSFEYLFAKQGIEFVSDLNLIADRHFDIAHVHHHINALEVRLFFPKLPVFFLSHGANTFLEKPPGIDINITQYGAVSQLVAQSLHTVGIKKQQISIVPNIIDETVFFPTTPIHQKPLQALVISNRMDEKTMTVIKRACQKLSIEVTAVGSAFKKIDNLEMPSAINEADIVFTIGRGVMESMMCGRIPFVLDRRGGDGFVTPRNYKQLEKVHFNGQYKKKTYTVNSLVKELRTYDATKAASLHTMTMNRYSSQACVTQLEKIYSATIKKYSTKNIDTTVLKYIVDSIHVTRLYTFSRSEQRGLIAKAQYFREDLPRILKSFSLVRLNPFPSSFGFRLPKTSR